MAETASCKSRVTDCEVSDAFKQASLEKLPGLDGSPYEVYFGLLLVAILMNVFAQ